MPFRPNMFCPSCKKHDALTPVLLEYDPKKRWREHHVYRCQRGHVFAVPTNYFFCELFKIPIEVDHWGFLTCQVRNCVNYRPEMHQSTPKHMRRMCPKLDADHKLDRDEYERAFRHVRDYDVELPRHELGKELERVNRAVEERWRRVTEEKEKSG